MAAGSGVVTRIPTVASANEATVAGQRPDPQSTITWSADSVLNCSATWRTNATGSSRSSPRCSPPITRRWAVGVSQASSDRTATLPDARSARDRGRRW